MVNTRFVFVFQGELIDRFLQRKNEMEGRVSKIDQVKGYFSKIDHLQCIMIAVDRYFTLTSSFDRLFKRVNFYLIDC